ncbi:MAG: pyrroloquinoline quinone biosynthesis protein C, partial [Pseudomonadota bacterium]
MNALSEDNMIQNIPWTREEFEDKLREKGKGYHIYHPFHVMMYEGKL